MSSASKPALNCTNCECGSELDGRQIKSAVRSQTPHSDVGSLRSRNERAFAEWRVTVQVSSYGFQDILANILPIVWRRRRVLYATVIAAAAGAFLFYSVTGERYEAYTLLRIGQG